MKNFIFIVLTATLIFSFSGCSLPTIKSIRDSNPSADTIASPTPVQTNLVSIKDGAISPKFIKINLSRTVVFQNLDKTPIKITSDPHPDHSDLPDLYSPPIYKGETYTYTFIRAGSWGYHLEDNPSVKGEVVVE